MNLTHLKYAVEVEKTGSITKAADNLFMGQPNLSKAIKELEQQVGIAIFRRTSRGVAPTRKGEEFLAYAKAILEQIEEMEAIYRPGRERSSLHLCIPRASYLSYAFAQFIRKVDFQKEMDVTLRESNATDAIAGVAEGESALGVIRYALSQQAFYAKQLEEKGLEGELLWEFAPVVLLSAEHPLAGQAQLCQEQLEGYIELVHGDLENARPMALADARRAQAERQEKKVVSVYERGSQLELLAAVPQAYMLCSPLPAAMLSRYGLVQRPCLGAERYQDVFIFPRGFRPTELEQAFLEQVVAVRQEIAQAAQA